MEILISSLHALVCVCLILVVLLQHGKGADMGVTLGGGGSNTVFGARGAGNFLTKLTTGAAVVFMVTSLVLSRLATQTGLDDLLDAAPQTEAPGTPGALPIDEGGAPTGFESIDPDAPAPAGFEAIEPGAVTPESAPAPTDAAPTSEAPAPAEAPAPEEGP